jgi:hypothetical protein
MPTSPGDSTSRALRESAGSICPTPRQHGGSPMQRPPSIEARRIRMGTTIISRSSCTPSRSSGAAAGNCFHSIPVENARERTPVAPSAPWTRPSDRRRDQSRRSSCTVAADVNGAWKSPTARSHYAPRLGSATGLVEGGCQPGEAYTPRLDLQTRVRDRGMQGDAPRSL